MRAPVTETPLTLSKVPASPARTLLQEEYATFGRGAELI